MAHNRWVLLAYRLPREPSTPRITLWRRLRRLGVAQVADGVVALPLDARTREQLEWLADEIVARDGQASIWLAEPATAAQERDLAAELRESVRGEYARLIEEVRDARDQVAGQRRRTLARLRRELRRIRARDYFPSPASADARAAVEALASTVEAVR